MYNNPYGPRKGKPPLEGLEARFNALPAWERFGLIGLSALVTIASGVVTVALIVVAVSPPSQPAVAQVSAPTPIPSPAKTATLSPASQSTHYPPKMVVDLYALAAKGNASTIHEFHSEGVGVATCPQPKREVTVDPSVTGEALAEDLLAYYYAQKLDNLCGTLVLAYRNQSEAGDAYTAGRILVDVTDSNGIANTDPNASNLKHQLTLDIGGVDANQEYVVTY